MLVHQAVCTFEIPVNYLHAVYAHQTPFKRTRQDLSDNQFIIKGLEKTKV